jgi:hypothetical protein
MNIKIGTTALIFAFFCEFTPVEVNAAEREPNASSLISHARRFPSPQSGFNSVRSDLEICSVSKENDRDKRYCD